MSISVVRDFRNSLGVARDQGARPTCVAFATSDTHAGCHKHIQPLSSEYAYFHAIRREAGNPHTGTSLNYMLQAVEYDGQPVEAAWPYLPLLPADLSNWKPPPDVGQLHRGRSAICTGPFADLCAMLDQNRPVLIVLTISNAFFAPDAEFVVDSSEAPDASLVHAIVAVGHGARGSKRFVLVRNSWGASWGEQGHAWVSELYLASRLLHFVKIEKVP
jgi:hypothetical protein